VYEKEHYSIVGKPRPRIDAVRQVTGKIVYVGDMFLPNMLFAKAVYSTEHHADILSVDVSKAETLPGVKAVLTCEDVPFNGIGVDIPDQPVLAEGRVRYKGEMVAAVAADTYEAACEAVRRVKVEYRRLPAVFDPREAMREDAPIIPPQKMAEHFKGNIHLVGTGHLAGGEKRECQRLRQGDVDAGFRASDVVMHKKFMSSVQKAASIEPICTLADWQDGSVTIWSTQQCPHGNAPAIAAALDIPLSRMRIICQAMGGGFGEKNQVLIEPITALLSKKAGAPVKFQMTTEEHMMWSGTRHPVYMELKLGTKNDGTLMALERFTVTGAGAYRSVAAFITGKITFWGGGPYNIPNQKADCYVVATNKQIGSAMRGFGMAQPTFAIEVMMDMLAERLRMDPLELRLKNVFHDGDYTATGQCVRAAGIEPVLRRVSEISGRFGRQNN
jgi:CO/xanthine dehydrogenase Mo-binding subunit